MTGPARLDRTLISVTGPDAHGFLQNLLTQDLDGLQAAGMLYAALLSPQGKVSADMFAWARENGMLLDADPTRGADLMRRLSMYKLRANVALEDVSLAFSVVVSDEHFDGAVRDPRLGGLGWRKLGSADENAFGDARSFEQRRIELGVPDLARDAAADEVFAGEALLEELNGVAFDKGCFVGQENVSRMKRRATTRKKLCPISFEGEPPAFGTPVLVGEAEIGTVRTGVTGRALALLRLDRALEAQAAGKTLTVANRVVSLAPPPWLILPQREDSVG